MHTHLVQPAASRAPNKSSTPPQIADGIVTPFSVPIELEESADSAPPMTVAST